MSNWFDSFYDSFSLSCKDKNIHLTESEGFIKSVDLIIQHSNDCINETHSFLLSWFRYNVLWLK